MSPVSRRQMLRRRAIAALATVAAVGVSLDAQAQNCPTSGWGPWVYVRLTTTDFPHPPQQQNHYNNNLKYQWDVHLPVGTVAVQARTASFSMSSGDRFIQYGNSQYNVYSGSLSFTTLSPDWTPYFTPNSGAKAMKFEWETNAAGTNYDPFISLMRFRCSSWPMLQDTQPIDPNTRYDGITYNPGNILYFNVTQPYLKSMVITVDRQAGDADYDLFVSTVNAYPYDTSTAEWVSVGSSTHSEAVRIPPVLATRQLYIGVRALSGSGHFAFHANAQEYTLPGSIDVCAMEPIGPAIGTNWDEFVLALQRNSATVMNMTQGAFFPYRYFVRGIPTCYDGEGNIDNFCGCASNCDVCVSHPATGGEACAYQYRSGRARIPSISCSAWDFGNGFGGMAHELGHSMLGLEDSYAWGDYPQYPVPNPVLGGHTIMNGPATTFWMLSTPRDHCLDFDINPRTFIDPTLVPPAPFHPTVLDCDVSDWDRVVGAGLVPSSVAPATSLSPDPTPSYWNEKLTDTVEVYDQ